MADQRLQYNEYVIGAQHPTETDTANRLCLVGHNNDGTHKNISLTIADNANVVGLAMINNDVTNDPNTLTIDNNTAGKTIDIDHDHNTASDITGIQIDVANAGAGDAFAIRVAAGWVGILKDPTVPLDVSGTINATAYTGGNVTDWDAAKSHASGNGADHANVATNTSHLSATGASHSYIDQAVTIAGTPQFARLGIGAAADGTAQLKLAFDAAAYMKITQADAAGVTFDCVSDGTPSFTFSDHVALSASLTVANYVEMFGAWAGKSVGTSYLADTDGFAVGLVEGAGTNTALSDGSNPPTTARGYVSSTAATKDSFCMPVKKGDYYKFHQTSGMGCTVFWIPKGTGM